MSIPDKVAVIALCLNVFTVVGAAVTWWANSLKKSYAAQRDFAHLQRNQEQIKQAIALLQDSDDNREKQFHELKGLIEGLKSRY